jgi:exopolysaccharide biosynthesis polyprenyl glycosylphosphotransferase
MSKTLRRNADIRLQALLALSDVAALLSAVTIAYGLRFYSALTALVPVTKGIPPLRQYLEAALVLAAVSVPTFAALGLYRPRLRPDFSTQLEASARGIAVGTTIAFALTFFYRAATFSRLTLAIAVALLFLLMPWGRVLLGRLAGRWRQVSGLAVVGSGLTAKALASRLAAAGEPGTRLVGRFGDDAGTDGAARPLGPVGAVAGAVGGGQIDRVLLALSLEESARAPEILSALAPYPVEVEWLPDIYGLARGRARADEVAGIPVVVLGEFPLLGWNGVVKRTMDLSLSLAGLIGLSPLLAAIALFVRLSGPGPIIYRQERVGRDGQRFEMLKFRTMEADAESASGPIPAQRSDPRITRIGTWLRRMSLDELPQLVNVVRGEMSLVGPRPERPCFIDDLAGEIPAYLHRQRVKSGMTGWAQIHGLRGGESSMAERVLCDLYYIENWSVGLDLRILLRTVITLHRQRNAY